MNCTLLWHVCLDKVNKLRQSTASQIKLIILYGVPLFQCDVYDMQRLTILNMAMFTPEHKELCLLIMRRKHFVYFLVIH